MKTYKRALRLVPILIILVILPRVSSFVRSLAPGSTGFDLHDIIAFAFAAVLGIGTITTAYFSDETEAPEYEEESANPRERKRREREGVYYQKMHDAAPYARRAMILFALADGAFNLADAAMGAYTNGLLDVENSILRAVYYAGVFIFGIAPTILSITLTRVISMVDRIPEDYEKPKRDNSIDWTRTLMANLGLKVYSDRDYSDDHRTPNRTRQMPKTNGEQARRIVELLEQSGATAESYPSVNEIRNALKDNPPSRSTISVARQNWLDKINQDNPWRSSAN